MKKESTEQKSKKIKELFVQDLARVEGGSGPLGKKSLSADCPEYTTFSLGEESPECEGR